MGLGKGIHRGRSRLPRSNGDPLAECGRPRTGGADSVRDRPFHGHPRFSWGRTRRGTPWAGRNEAARARGSLYAHRRSIEAHLGPGARTANGSRAVRIDAAAGARFPSAADERFAGPSAGHSFANTRIGARSGVFAQRAAAIARNRSSRSTSKGSRSGSAAPQPRGGSAATAGTSQANHGIGRVVIQKGVIALVLTGARRRASARILPPELLRRARVSTPRVGRARC
jgi:hypothetical protein